ncbi:MAG: hypothetical protein WCV50_04385 [Patescibacteria group bacterium]
MSTEKIDCERFVRGCEEIDRKRKVITRILTSVESLLSKSAVIKGNKWKFGQIILEIPFGEYVFSISHHKGFLTGEIHNDKLDTPNTGWWGTTDYADAIPASVVPIVYASLQHIVEEIDKALPQAGIRVHFEFFSSQAVV